MKFMNMKRFASVAMAGVMTLSLAVPAFASQSTVITGTYQEIEIAVEVPTTGTAQINPYGLPVTIDKTDKTSVDLVDQQITTQPMSIKNQGTTPLDVNATLAVLPTGDVSIITGAAGTDKGIKVDLEVAALNDAALAVATTEKTLEDKLIDKFASEATWSGLTATNKLAAPAAAKGATTVTANKSSAALATLGAATVSGSTITYGAKSIALVRLAGDLAEAPVKGSGSSATDDPWTTDDGFEATVVFSFKPAAKMDITISSPTGAGAALSASPSSAWEGTVVTLTSTPPTANPTHVPTYKVVSTAAPTDTTKEVTVTDGKFTMPDYAVTVSVTFAAAAP